MRALLVRVGADQSEGGGFWNGPVNVQTRAFAYVPIPESKPCRTGLATPYSEVAPAVERLCAQLPTWLANSFMHLDPDFASLTYGDQGKRAQQIQLKLREHDLLVFYAGLADVTSPRRLLYALIGLYVVGSIVPAPSVPEQQWHANAHTRRLLEPEATDIVVRAKPGVSGRLERCIPIGSFRDRAYRVEPGLLVAWGGLGVREGYLQRSARLPELLAPERFLAWFQSQKPVTTARNN
jgi:hypothetical protein